MTRPDRSDASDRQLITSAREGDEAAHAELVARYRPRVFDLVYRLVGNRELAEDLTQETFVKLLDGLDGYQSDRKLAPWLLTIGNNTAVQYLRRERPDSTNRPITVTPGYIDASAFLPPSDTPTPEPQRRGFAAALENALQQLKPAYRRCVWLHYVEGLSYDEIADIMNVPAATVGTYLHRARKQLKPVLGDLLDRPASDPTPTPA